MCQQTRTIREPYIDAILSMRYPASVGVCIRRGARECLRRLSPEQLKSELSAAATIAEMEGRLV